MDRIEKMRNVVDLQLKAVCLQDCPMGWVAPILSELRSVLDDVIDQAAWCDRILDQVKDGQFNKLGPLQGAAGLLDIVVGKAMTLIKLLPDELRKQLE